MKRAGHCRKNGPSTKARGSRCSPIRAMRRRWRRRRKASNRPCGRISPGWARAIMSHFSPISTATPRILRCCNRCGGSFAIAPGRRPASASGRAFCTRPGRLTREGRTAASFCRLPAMIPRICRSPDKPIPSASSRRRRRAAISRFSPSAAGGRCGSICPPCPPRAWRPSPAPSRQRSGRPSPRDSERAEDQKMQLGVIGLGRMGGNFVRQLAKPRAVWVMLPAGAVTHQTILALSRLLEAEDILIDGGNSFFQDDIRHAEMLKERGIRYVDVGTSGGIWGLERGYCMMIGGDREAVEHLDPIFRTLAPGVGNIPRTPGREGRDPRVEQGYMYCGPAGAGHFVKMVHNGIEYGIMQAYAEGFDILKNVASPAVPENRRYRLDLADIARVWRQGSVIASWLLDLTASALAADVTLSEFSGYVEDSGEGRWTIGAAIEEAVPVNVLSAALYARFRSRQEHSYAERILSAMRKEFGGHREPPVRKAE